MTLPDQIKALPRPVYQFGHECAPNEKVVYIERVERLLEQAASLAADAITDIRHAVRWAPSSAHWSERLRHHLGADARDGINRLEQDLRREFAIKTDEYDARTQKLAEALKRLLAVQGAVGCTYWDAVEAARDALREQKEQAR